ncbi:hypothetical protein C8Q80DRAFT_1266320 [Daedaleopsis nitida]|nr:hypothetical protein C8Q80DRAFT_1266320 [Daedaleopsis nitida]
MLSIVSFMVAALALQASQASSLPSNNHTAVTASSTTSRKLASVKLNSIPAYPGVTLGTPTYPFNQTTSPQAAPATVILCDGLECDIVTEECEAFNVLEVTSGVCLPTRPFRSVIVLQPGDDSMRALITPATLLVLSFHRASATIPSSIVSRVETFPITTLPITSLHAHPRDLTIPTTSQQEQADVTDVAEASPDAFLLVCSDSNCPIALGRCQVLNVSAIPLEPSGEGFPFGIFITPDECETFTQLTVDRCFNVGGGIFPFDFILLGEI